MTLTRYLLCAIALFTTLNLQAQREKIPPEDLAIVQAKWPNAKKTSTGLRYIILREGTEDLKPKAGDYVSVCFTGRLIDDKVFNECTDPAHPFITRVGREELIAAWDESLPTMKKGEKRLIIVPYELGYGTRGQPPRVPRRATLIFEMELLDIGAHLEKSVPKKSPFDSEEEE